MDHAWGGVDRPSNEAATSELDSDADATSAPLAIEDGEVNDEDAHDDGESDVPTTEPEPEQTLDDDYCPEAPEVDITPRHLESLFEEVSDEPPVPEDSQGFDFPETQVEMFSDTPTDWGDLGSAGWPDKSELPSTAEMMPPPPPPCPEHKKRRNEVVEKMEKLRLGRPNSIQILVQISPSNIYPLPFYYKVVYSS